MNPARSRLDEQCDESAPAGSSEERPDPIDAAKRIPHLLQELQSYSSYYLAIRKELAVSRVRNIVLKAALSVIAGLAGLAIICTAGVLLLTGVAQGLGNLLGNRLWLGNLIVGAVVLAAITGAVRTALARVRRTAREAIVARCEQLKQGQRNQFHHTAVERAGAVPLEGRKAESTTAKS